MKIEEAVKILEKHNEWRQDKGNPIVSPCKLGEAINCLSMGFKDYKINLLMDFLFYMNEEGLINNHDFEYIEVVKRYIDGISRQ